MSRRPWKTRVSCWGTCTSSAPLSTSIGALVSWSSSARSEKVSNFASSSSGLGRWSNPSALPTMSVHAELASGDRRRTRPRPVRRARSAASTCAGKPAVRRRSSRPSRSPGARPCRCRALGLRRSGRRRSPRRRPGSAGPADSPVPGMSKAITRAPVSAPPPTNSGARPSSSCPRRRWRAAPARCAGRSGADERLDRDRGGAPP